MTTVVERPPTQPSAVEADWMSATRERVETALKTICRTDDVARATARSHALRDAGRRQARARDARPRGRRLALADRSRRATRGIDAAACAAMIHAYSLVHDDLPCMDDDALRRGKPTVHVEYDEATALLAGDALQTLAFEVLAGPQRLRVASSPLVLLAPASGSVGMAGGQAIDLESVGKR